MKGNKYVMELMSDGYVSVETKKLVCILIAVYLE